MNDMTATYSPDDNKLRQLLPEAAADLRKQIEHKKRGLRRAVAQAVA